MLQKDEEKPEVKTDVEQSGEEKKPDGDSANRVATIIANVLVWGFLLGFFLTCTRAGCYGGGDGTWDRVEHSVNTDPYFDQW